MAPTPPWPATADGAGLFSCRLHPAGILLDPPVAAPRGAQLMINTFWPEPASPDGWARRGWQRGPDGRGFLVPPVTDLGDTIALTAYRQVTPAAADSGLRGFVRRQAVAASTPPVRTVFLGTWFGYLHAIERDALVLHGPFDNATAAHSAAQQGLLRRLRPPAPPTGGQLPVHPGQPPAAVSLSIDGPTATVGDPAHGWLAVPADQLLAAMALPTTDLHQLLRHHHPALAADTAQVTLAALAARDLPHQLPDILTRPTAHRDAVDPASDLTDITDQPEQPDPPDPAAAADPLSPADDVPGPQQPVGTAPAAPATPQDSAVSVDTAAGSGPRPGAGGDAPGHPVDSAPPPSMTADEHDGPTTAPAAPTAPPDDLDLSGP
ncbi:hypothetical protein [Pseudofrankia sp. DC12]|uniref:hypothetical protein n=1 Tax=Pseudofrankia sp. DC12 TaxID=683315 RepID=UPI0012F94553|nr:hypothetical protein [Pseudofrankia sp. DC12]